MVSIRIGHMHDRFLSDSTWEQFHRYWEQQAHQAQYIVVIAGTSAQIRSQLCREVAGALVDRGYNLERIHAIYGMHNLVALILQDFKIMVVSEENLVYLQLPQNKIVIHMDLQEVTLEELFAVVEGKIRDLQEQRGMNMELILEYWSHGQPLTSLTQWLQEVEVAERTINDLYQSCLDAKQLQEKQQWLIANIIAQSNGSQWQESVEGFLQIHDQV